MGLTSVRLRVDDVDDGDGGGVVFKGFTYGPLLFAVPLGVLMYSGIKRGDCGGVEVGVAGHS